MHFFLQLSSLSTSQLLSGCSRDHSPGKTRCLLTLPFSKYWPFISPLACNCFHQLSEAATPGAALSFSQTRTTHGKGASNNEDPTWYWQAERYLNLYKPWKGSLLRHSDTLCAPVTGVRHALILIHICSSKLFQNVRG